MSHPSCEVPRDRQGLTAALLALGFGAAVALWWVGYLTHLPGVVTLFPGPVVLGLLLVCLVGGGVLAGRRLQRPLVWGPVAGLLTAAVNMMVFGSLLTEGADGPNRLAPGAALGAAGFLATGAVCGAVGALLGSWRRADTVPGTDWRGAMGGVAAAATLLVLVTGGVVTTTETGMAVPDWPTSFESQMFLLPLSKMVGGVYFEHAHRLFGSLVGITTLAWAVLLARSEGRIRFLLGCLALFGVLAGAGRYLVPESWLFSAVAATTLVCLVLVLRTPPGQRAAPAAAFVFLLVCNQGILGGNRVLLDSAGFGVGLAALHGVSGQLLFAILVAVAAFDSWRWRQAVESHREITTTGDRKLSRFVLGTLVVQLALGALLRHYGMVWLAPHIGMALLGFLLATAVATRALSFYKDVLPLRRVSLLFLGTVIIQFALGFAALGAVGTGETPGTTLAILVPTMHQALGALVLALGTVLTVWIHLLWSPDAVVSEPSSLASSERVMDVTSA